MPDIFSKEKRSEVMGMVKTKNTKPEIFLRKCLHKLGFRFRIHDKSLPGRPDIKLSKYRAVIFVNGCFWHGHENCRYYTIPETNKNYWKRKLQENIQRDIQTYKKLQDLGWKVIIVWTCQLKKNQCDQTLNEIVSGLSKEL